MSRRKHITQALNEEVQPPSGNQSIVRALGTRGGNIVEVRALEARGQLVIHHLRWQPATSAHSIKLLLLVRCVTRCQGVAPSTH